LIRDITQFGSVSALGAESRRFESFYPDFIYLECWENKCVWIKNINKKDKNSR
jgi:hypothetical protein